MAQAKGPAFNSPDDGMSSQVIRRQGRKGRSRVTKAAVRCVVERLEPRQLLSAVPVGAEFRVNTYTTNAQELPRIASDSAGDFVVAWISNGQDGGSYGVYAQRYNAAGVAQGSEFRVNTYTTGNQWLPSVAMDSAGDFVISWESQGQDGSGYGVYAQRYNAAGAAQGGEFQVNTYTTSFQGYPSVAMDSAGDFVISWTSYGQDGSNDGIYAQRYSAAGVAQGGDFQVNAYTTSDQSFPSAAMDSSGGFVISWIGLGGSGNGVYAQRYNAAGVALGSEFGVDTYTTTNLGRPSAAMDSAGDFVVTWDSYRQDDTSYGVYARRYSAAGVAQGGAFRVNTYTTLGLGHPSAAMDSAGDFVIAWQSDDQDGSAYGIYAQRYNAAGVAQAGEFRANTFTTGEQEYPCVAMDTAGDFVISWTSLNQDGSGFGVYAQRYSVSPSPSPTTSTAITSSAGSAAYGQPVTLTATIAPSSGSGETGAVEFQVDGYNAGTPVSLSGNTATYVTSALTVGSHSIVAMYSGDSTFAGSTSPVLLQNVTGVGSQFVNVLVLGSTDGVNYSSSQTVTPGETVYYEVELYLAGSGASNTHQTNPLSTQKGPNIDGVNTISLDLGNSDTSVNGITSALGPGWGNATGANAGTASGSTVTAVGAGQSAGTFVGWNQSNASVVIMGSFIAGTAPMDTVTAKWDTGVATGGIKILLTNGVNKAAPITNATEASSDPYIGYTPMVLTQALPIWMAPTSHATWNGTTLTVIGAATMIADPGPSEPLIVASGSAAQLTIAPISDADIHVGGINLTNGAGIDVASVGVGRSHAIHNTLVIGTLGSAADPIFSVDASSTLNLEDNDLIVHTGSNDANGYSELAAVQAVARTGRAGGAWNGKGLISTAAENQDQSDGMESVQLGVVDNRDLGSPFSTWQVGSAVETLGASDIVVKYTYSGDFTLDGKVDFNDTTIFGAYFDNGASSGNEWAFGDTNGDGLLNFLDAANFGLEYGNGTGSPSALDPVQL